MKKTIARLGTAVATVALAFGLTACGGESGETGGESTGGGETSEEVPAGESDEFLADVAEAVKIINDQIAAESSPMTQIMLASDVDNPTQKYGMWVMPFYPSDATEKYMSTIQITDGTDFVVELTSAATGKVWTSDQDGNVSEKTA
ncbi:hypothetical protein SAMN06298212_11325 [Ruaniaceae bacterium KH17]|nr:hypothetical protein SAMN06298212_11325 [Ruaniaceae bacterium KH17]